VPVVLYPSLSFANSEFTFSNNLRLNRRRRLTVLKHDRVALALVDVGHLPTFDFAVLELRVRFGADHCVLLNGRARRHYARAATANAADIERGKTSGELASDADPELIIDAVFGAIFYRLLFRSSPLTEEFSDKLVRQVLRGARARAGEATTRSKPRRVKPA
jgi:hypothetical protein